MCNRTLLCGHASAILLALALASPVGAQQKAARREIQAASQEIRGFLRTRGASAVALEPLASRDATPSNAGPGLCLLLREELLAAGVKISSSADLKVGGFYQVSLDRKSKRPMVYLVLQVAEAKKGKSLLKVTARGVFGVEDVAAAAGATVVLAPDASQAKRAAALRAALERPKVDVAGARVLAGTGSPYGVEIWVKEEGEYRQRKPEVKGGLAYVPLKRGEVYAVRLINSSKLDAAATLSIDGLHCFSFCKKQDAGGRALRPPFLVPPGKEVLVRGWPINEKRSEEFLVTGYAQSAVAELKGDLGKVGVITVTFAAAWERGHAPADEPEGKGDATGRGAPVDAPFTITARQIGRTRAVISIRYTR